MTVVVLVEEAIREAACTASVPMVVPPMSLESLHKCLAVITEKAAAMPATVSKPPHPRRMQNPWWPPTLEDSQPLAAPLPKYFLCPVAPSPGQNHLPTVLCPEGSKSPSALSPGIVHPLADSTPVDFLADAFSTAASHRSCRLTEPGPFDMAAAPALELTSTTKTCDSVSVQQQILVPMRDKSPPSHPE